MSIPTTLAADIRRRITAGELVAGDRLEPTRVAAAQLGVSRGCVVAAYERPAGEGYLTAGPGGTRVNPSLPAPPVAAAPAPAAPAAAPPQKLRPGVPDQKLITTALWRQAWRAAAADPTHHPVPGSAALRAQIVDHLRATRSVTVSPEQVLVTAGARDGLRTILQALPGARVAVEDPGFPTLHHVPRAAGHEILPVPADACGMRVDVLDRLAPEVVLVMPNHRYPLGTQMAGRRRVELIEWARKAGAVVIEDDYDSELRRAHPALLALDPQLGRVAMLGSFAKTLSPALGVGYLIVPDGLRRAVHGLASPVSGIAQDALAEFLARDGLRRHTARMRREYERREQIFREVFDRGRTMDGGLHAIVEVADEQEAVARARAAGFGVAGLGEYWTSAAAPGLVVGLGTHAGERLRATLVSLRTILQE